MHSVLHMRPMLNISKSQSMSMSTLDYCLSQRLMETGKADDAFARGMKQ